MSEGTASTSGTRGVGRVLGIDAAGKYGWLGVVAERGAFGGARLGSIHELIDWAAPVDVIGIDIPLGHLPHGIRLADVEARRFVGVRRSSVFPAPPAEVLEAESYSAANEQLSSRGLPKLSQQAWALIPKIVEAAEVARSEPRMFEVHPEVSFREMSGEDLRWSKKSWNGLLQRRRLLVEAGVVLPDVIPEVDGAVADDVVDAAAAAWSACRIAEGTARSLPDPPEDHGGRQVCIWC